MADVITGSTELDPAKQEIIREIVQRELREAVTILPTVTDMSASATPGSKTVKVPRLTSFTVVDRASGAAGDASALASSTDDLLLDTNAFVSWIIDSFDEIQANIPAQLEFSRRAATAQGRFVDKKVIDEIEAAAVATTTAGDISRDVVLEMREALLRRNANKDRLWLAVPPTQETNLLKVAEFSNADVYGSAIIPSGMLGRVFGVPVILNNQLGDNQFFMYESEGLAIAFQQRPRLASQPEIAFGTNARRFALDQIFGVKAMQVGIDPKTEGLAATESPLLVKDNN